MWRSFAILLLTFPAINAYGQQFLENGGSYIYAVGVGKTQSSADEEAILSFSRTLQTKVTSIVTFDAIDRNGEVEKTATKNVVLDNSVIAKNVKQLVKLDGDIYTVYRYIDREQYIEERVSLYNDYLAKARRYRETEDAHRLNFIIGAYYLAFQSIDDAIMDIINPDNGILKDYAMREAQREYSNASRLEFMGNGRSLVKCNTGLPLYGFQYLGRDGRWKLPEAYFIDTDFLAEDSRTPENRNYRCCLIKNGGKEVMTRKTYEIPALDYGIAIINVPENWYFYKNRL